MQRSPDAPASNAAGLQPLARFSAAENAAMQAALAAAAQGPRGANPLVGAVVVGPTERTSPPDTTAEPGLPTPRLTPSPRRRRRAWTSAAPRWW